MIANQSQIFGYAASQIIYWCCMIVSTQGYSALTDMIEDSTWSRN